MYYTDLYVIKCNIKEAASLEELKEALLELVDKLPVTNDPGDE